jgi:RND family efflux transporter MFP subunit
MRTWLLTGAWLLSLLSGIAAAAELPFEVAVVELRKVQRERVYDAQIEPVQETTVSAQTSGQIQAIYFDVDDYVPKDSVLLRFQDTEQRAGVAAGKATVAEAQARVKQTDQEYKRAKELFDKKLSSTAELDRATAERNSARARLEAAKAELQKAEEQLAYTVVRAPYAGIVVKRHVEVGETANVGNPLMTGLSLEQLRAVANVPQNVVGRIRALGAARIVLTTKDHESLAAAGITVSPYADATSHTFKVRVDLPPGEHGVYPGMFAKVAFVVGEATKLLVPAKAVVNRSEVTGVYLVGEDGRVVLRQVRLGRPAPGGRLVVLAGLREGDRVALDPVRAGVYLKQQGEQRAGEAS